MDPPLKRKKFSGDDADEIDFLKEHIAAIHNVLQMLVNSRVPSAMTDNILTKNTQPTETISKNLAQCNNMSTGGSPSTSVNKVPTDVLTHCQVGAKKASLIIQKSTTARDYRKNYCPTKLENEPSSNFDEDSEFRCLLGNSPDENMSKKLILDKRLIPYIKHWYKTGLDEDLKESIFKAIPLMGDNIRLTAPNINEEVALTMSEIARKRDDHFKQSHKICATALASAAIAMTELHNSNKDTSNFERERLLQMLANIIMLLSDSLHSTNVARRAFITPAYDKRTKRLLEKEDSEELLFGDKLADRFKELHSMEKTVRKINSRKSATFSGKRSSMFSQDVMSFNRKGHYYNDNASYPFGNYFQMQPVIDSYGMSTRSRSRLSHYHSRRSRYLRLTRNE